MAAATRLFAEKGYLGTGIRDIEDAVGIRRGALYYHIGNKENLLYEISHGQITPMNERAGEIVDSDLPAERKLRAMAHLLMQAIVDNQLATTVFFRDWIWLEGERRAEILAIRDEFEKHVERIIEEGVAAGTWADRGPLVTKGVLGMLNHTYVWFRPDGSVTADELADTFTDILLYGLGPNRAGTDPANSMKTSLSSTP
ncbi:TetR/AcrR family transcriptional regulator [Nocardia nova]|uniref:TetR/AcrR family transcriptional regulator n=1 Tax=Nocardia nova TaxID=37330 RepID=UPI00130EA7F6|nr:TetR/AcrR family transcriptional regulator [Nocardia nova]